jgi:alkylated DNA repair dioxygenase AlkB
MSKPEGLRIIKKAYIEKCSKSSPCLLKNPESNELPCLSCGIKSIDSSNWLHLDHICTGKICNPDNSQKSEKKHLSRRTQHYGYEYNYSSSKLNGTNSLESNKAVYEFASTIENLFKKEKYGGNDDSKIEQCIVNEYTVGQNISPHIDSKNFGPIIITITLCGTATMLMSYNDENYSVELQPGDVVILSGEARYKWKHSIKNIKKSEVDSDNPRRISLTYRSIN